MECYVGLSIDQITSRLLRLENDIVSSNFFSHDEENAFRDEARALTEAWTLFCPNSSSVAARNAHHQPAPQCTYSRVERRDEDLGLLTSHLRNLTSSQTVLKVDKR